MTTNETIINKKIAKWLGFKFNHRKTPYNDYINTWYDTNGLNVGKLDFLHDRNQQKWIEDKLIEDGYNIMIDYVKSDCYVVIKQKYKYEKYMVFNQSRDLAFIQAVEQLIDKEEK